MILVDIHENGLYLVVERDGQNQLKLLHFSSLPFDPSTLSRPSQKSGPAWDEKIGFQMAEVMISGLDRPSAVRWLPRRCAATAPSAATSAGACLSGRWACRITTTTGYAWACAPKKRAIWPCGAGRAVPPPAPSPT